MKKVQLAIALIVVIGAIWYLESMKVQPGSQGGQQAQPIGLPATAASSTPTGASSSASTSSTLSPQAIAANLAAIASADKAAGDTPAIEIADPTGFVNATSGFRLANLIGKKVILLDFWTYSCINCIRTLPYLTSWYAKYKDQGFVIVGIHSPEFDFEKNIANVRAAVAQYGIQYPVVLDNDHGTWQAYGNLYWPHEYLIDIAGYIVHDHIGEGDYDVTEGIIQKLLMQRATALGTATSSIASPNVPIAPPNLSGIGSPETYFGAARNEYLADGTPGTTGVQVLRAPSSFSPNSLYLDGSWNFAEQYATNENAGAKVFYEYDSAKVYLVASGAASGTVVTVLQDGAPISAAAAGSDVHNSAVTISSSRLYNIVNNPDGAGEHMLELIIQSPGLEAFTFTFG